MNLHFVAVLFETPASQTCAQTPRCPRCDKLVLASGGSGRHKDVSVSGNEML